MPTNKKSPQKIKNKGGRPKIEINQSIFENMCAYQCTKDEICGILDIDEKTLTRWCKDTYGLGFSEIYKKKCKVGLMSLRRIQWKHAEKNASMAMFLGKVYLNQKEREEEEKAPREMPEMEITVVDNSNLEKALYEANK